MKKGLSLVLSILLLLSITATFGLSAYAVTSGDFEYRLLSDGTAEITGYSGSATEIIIPSTVDGYTITSIDNEAFYGCTRLTSVTIPESVTSIGSWAFEDCTGLTKINWNAENASVYYGSFSGAGTAGSGIDVVFGDNVKKIPAHVFSQSDEDGSIDIKSVTIGNSVTSIGDYAFSGCTGLSEITIPDSVTSIGDGAFKDCTGLTAITIPDSVTSIGRSAFEDCTGLTKINWNAENVMDFCYEDGYEYSVFYNAGTAGSGIDVVFGDNVKTIPAYAFYQSFEEGSINIKSVTIGNSVISIGDYAFIGCSGLTNITIPDSVISIGDYAFSGCSGLTNITIPDSVISIGESAFEDCTGLTNVTIGNSVTSIGYAAFYNCTGLTSVTIPDSVTSIGDYVFIGCSGLTNITIPDSVTDIGDSAFAECTGLTNVTIGNSVTCIENSAFNCCFALTSIIISDSVETIGYSAFRQCYSLPEITLPESVEKISDSAFSLCHSLKDIYIMNPDCIISNDYDSIPPQTVIHGYHNSTAWKYANDFDRNFIPFDAHTLEAEFILPATCSAYGFRTLSCEYCDYKTNETIEPLGHTDTDGDGLCDICKIGLSGGQTSCDHEYEIDYIAPTCSDSGKIIMTCSLCGKSSQKAIEATGHNYVDFVIEPTCTSDGYTKHYCINCGDEVRDSVVKALGHEMRTMTITPTCTENGCDIEICNNCGYNYETNMVYALGHMDEDNNGECDDCGYKIETQEEPTKISFFEKLIALLRRFIEMIISLFK